MAQLDVAAGPDSEAGPNAPEITPLRRQLKKLNDCANITFEIRVPVIYPGREFVGSLPLETIIAGMSDSQRLTGLFLQMMPDQPNLLESFQMGAENTLDDILKDFSAVCAG